MKKTIKELWNRLISDVPVFWKKVQSVAISFGIAAVAVWVANSQLGLELEPLAITICKYTIVVCCVITGQAQFTIKGNNDATV